MRILDRPYSVINQEGSIKQYYKFYNGYGAAIIRNKIKNPLGDEPADIYLTFTNNDTQWELAVTIWHPNSDKIELCYDTPLTPDVMGYLSEDEVEEYLQKISKLPSRIGLVFNTEETKKLLELLEADRLQLAQKAWVCERYGEELELVKGIIDKINRTPREEIVRLNHELDGRN